MKVLDKLFFYIFSLLIDDSFALKKIYNTKVGEDCRLNKNNYGEEPFLISFGNNVSAINVDFITHDGAVWLWRNKNPKLDLFKSIKIESNVFIGHRSIILPGTHIFSNVIIGAGSVVKGEIKENKVYAGVPARPICSIDDYFNKNEKYFHNTKLLNYKNKKKYLNKNKKYL